MSRVKKQLYDEPTPEGLWVTSYRFKRVFVPEVPVTKESIDAMFDFCTKEMWKAIKNRKKYRLALYWKLIVGSTKEDLDYYPTHVAVEVDDINAASMKRLFYKRFINHLSDLIKRSGMEYANLFLITSYAYLKTITVSRRLKQKKSKSRKKHAKRKQQPRKKKASRKVSASKSKRGKRVRKVRNVRRRGK